MRSNKKFKKFKKYCNSNQKRIFLNKCYLIIFLLSHFLIRQYFPISIKFYDQRLEVIINNFNYAKQSRLIFIEMQIGNGKNCEKIYQQGQKTSISNMSIAE